MKKKNLAALLMAGAMCFSLLAGCSGGSETGGTGTQDPEEPSQGAEAT